MSRHIITAGPKHDPLSELDIDELVERLTPGTKKKEKANAFHLMSKQLCSNQIDVDLFE